jgi:RNA polymerase sigma-70 factor, ECF subfamily
MKPSLVLVDAPAEAPELLTLDGAFRRYASYVAAVAIRLLGRDDEVDDVVQDVFLAAQRGLGQLRDPNAVKQWLATVTVRIARRRLRLRRLRRMLGFGTSSGYENLAAPGATPDDRALLSCVYAVLDELPVGERIAWTLRYVEGERLDTVARLCGCSLATAKRRIAAAQETLERMLADE